MPLLAALLLAGAASEPLPRDMPPALHGACVMHLDGWEGPYDAKKARALFGKLRASGAQAVSLSAFVWADALHSTELRPFDGDERARAGLAAAIRDAKAEGLAVFVKPHLEIGREGKRDESLWRGEIRFEAREAAAAWFASYRSFALDLASLCEEEGVELLAIGLELAGLSSSWPEEWSRLIKELRAVYSGRLTYCANWWGEFGQIELWAELDLLGVQAFAPLSTDPDATQEELGAGTRSLVSSWRREAERWGKGLVIAEFGFKSSPAPWIEPWQWKEGRPRPLAQARAHAALLDELERQDPERTWLAGSFVWLYEAARPSPGTGDPGFSPGGKPAERLLEAWWGRRVQPAAQGS